MAWTDLKAAVAAVIKTNGNQEITGALLQSTLNSIIDQVGANASYKGVAIPSTNPGTPDALVFYITSTQGTYANFGGFVLDGGFAILSNVSGSWTGTKFLKTELDAKADQTKLDQLAGEVSVLEQKNWNSRKLFDKFIVLPEGKDRMMKLSSVIKSIKITGCDINTKYSFWFIRKGPTGNYLIFLVNNDSSTTGYSFTYSSTTEENFISGNLREGGSIEIVVDWDVLLPDEALGYKREENIISLSNYHPLVNVDVDAATLNGKTAEQIKVESNKKILNSSFNLLNEAEIMDGQAVFASSQGVMAILNNVLYKRSGLIKVERGKRYQFQGFRIKVAGYLGWFNANKELIPSFYEGGVISSYPIGSADGVTVPDGASYSSIEYMSVNLAQGREDPIPYVPGQAMIFQSDTNMTVEYQPYTPYIGYDNLPVDIINEKKLNIALSQITPTLGDSQIKVLMSNGYLYIRQKYSDERDLIVSYAINSKKSGFIPYSSYLIERTKGDSVSDYMSGEIIHLLEDSNGPIYTKQYWYIGGLHGLVVTKVTANNHSKSVADIGSIWNGGGKNYVLTKIIDANTLRFFNPPILNGDGAGKDSYDYKMSGVSELVHQGGAANTTNITIESVSGEQTYPAVLPNAMKIQADNKDIEPNKTYICSSLKVVCNHTIINPRTIIYDVGNPDFMDYSKAGGLANIAITFEFHPLTVSMYHSFKVLDNINLGYYGFWQPLGLRNSETLPGMPVNQGVKIYVPHVLDASPNNSYNRNWGRLVDVTYPKDGKASGIPSDITRPEKWNIATPTWLNGAMSILSEGVNRCIWLAFERGAIHEEGDVGYYDIASKTIGFVSGFSPKIGVGIPSVHNNLSSSYGYLALGDRRKMYWSLLDSSKKDVLNGGEMYSALSYMTYFNPQLNPECNGVYWYKEGKKWGLYIDMLKQVDSLFIKLPTYLNGKVITATSVVGNISTSSDFIADGLFISTSDSEPAHLRIELE